MTNILKKALISTDEMDQTSKTKSTWSALSLFFRLRTDASFDYQRYRLVMEGRKLVPSSAVRLTGLLVPVQGSPYES